MKGWNAVINTNLNGTWYMMQAAAQRWRERKHPGNIVNIVVVQRTASTASPIASPREAA